MGIAIANRKHRCDFGALSTFWAVEIPTRNPGIGNQKFSKILGFLTTLIPLCMSSMRSGEMSCCLMWQQTHSQQILHGEGWSAFPLGFEGHPRIFTRFLENSRFQKTRPNCGFTHEKWPTNFDEFSRLALRLRVTFCMSPHRSLSISFRVEFDLDPNRLSSWRWWSITELLLAHPPPLLSESFWGTSQCGFRGFPFPGFLGSLRFCMSFQWHRRTWHQGTNLYLAPR